MVYKYYHVWLIVRIVLLLAIIFLAGTALMMIGERDLFFLPLILVIILIFQVIEFIFYINRTNREIVRIFLKNSTSNLQARLLKNYTDP